MKADRDKPALLEPRPLETVTSPHGSASITKEEAAVFVRHVLDLNQRKDIASILLCFADQVDYYDRGVVNRDYIRKDMGYYFRNWDTISSAVEGDVTLIVTDEPEVRTVKFVSSFAVANARKAIMGRTENIWMIRRINNELKIIDEKQRLLHSESR